MKKLHKPNLYCWSVFDQDRNIDFHSYVWVRENNKESNKIETNNSESSIVVIDPLPLSQHDEKHLFSLGKITHILISNSDHIRNSVKLAEQTGAEIWGPEAEKETFPISCSDWLKEGNEPLPGLKIYTMDGSKTPGELAFLIEDSTLITGDLIRAHEGGKLCLLPDPKLKDKAAAINSLKKLAEINTVEAVFPGDGWPVFRDGHKVLAELAESI